jgi:small subunit ribosomal protein S17
MAKQITGVVSSSKGDKTIVVTVQVRKTHPLYRKQYTVTSKFMAHDENNEAEVGDKVSIVETRPISARKHHKLDKIIQKPVLREDSIKLIKTEDEAAKPASKSKVVAEETETEGEA